MMRRTPSLDSLSRGFAQLTVDWEILVRNITRLYDLCERDSLHFNMTYIGEEDGLWLRRAGGSSRRTITLCAVMQICCLRGIRGHVYPPPFKTPADPVTFANRSIAACGDPRDHPISIGESWRCDVPCGPMCPRDPWGMEIHSSCELLCAVAHVCASESCLRPARATTDVDVMHNHWSLAVYDSRGWTPEWLPLVVAVVVRAGCERRLHAGALRDSGCRHFACNVRSGTSTAGYRLTHRRVPYLFQVFASLWISVTLAIILINRREHMWLLQAMLPKKVRARAVRAGLRAMGVGARAQGGMEGRGQSSGGMTGSMCTGCRLRALGSWLFEGLTW